MRLRELLNLRIIIIFFTISMLVSFHYVIGGITAGGDPGFYGIYDWRTFLEKGIYVWQENQLGRPNPLGVALIPFRAFLSTINEALGLKVAVYVLWLLTIFIGLISVYLFVKCLLVMEGFKGKNVEVASAVAAFAHVFTPIAVAWRIGGNRIGAIPHGMLPLMLLATLVISRQKSLRESIKYLLIFVPIFAFFGGSISNPVVIADFILAAVLLLLVYRKEINVKSTVISAVLVLLLFSWLIAAIYYATPSFVTTRQETLKPQGGFLGWAERYVEDYETPNALLLYPITFWIGLKAFQGYYTTPAVYVIWSLFIAIVLGLSIAKLKHRAHRGILYGVILYTVSVGLMMAPHLLYGQYLWIMTHISPLMAFRMTFDKFQYVAQLGFTIMLSYCVLRLLERVASLRDLKVDLNITKETIKASMPIITLIIVIIAIFLGALPAINGNAMKYPTRDNSPYLKSNAEYLEGYVSLIKKLLSNDPYVSVLVIPALKSSWVSTTWYNGSDYAFYAPGSILASGWLISPYANEIYSLISSKDFALNESKQERLLKLLRLGNVKYIVVRGDMDFIRSSANDLNIYLEYQIPNIMYLTRKYGFEKVLENGNVNLTEAIILPFDDSRAFTNFDERILLENFTISVTFRRDLNSWLYAISKDREDIARGVMAEIGNITVVDFGNGMYGVLAYNGTRVVPIAGRGPYDTGWHTLEVEKRGATLRIIVDGNPVTETYVKGLTLDLSEISLGLYHKKGLAEAFGLGFSFNGFIHNLVISSDTGIIFNLTEHYKDLIFENAIVSLADPLSPKIFWVVYKSPFNLSSATALEENLSEVNASKVNPTRYVIEVDDPRSIIVSTAYDPRWRATISSLDGSLRISSMEDYFGLLRIDIDGNGRGYVILEYGPQERIKWLCVFSLVVYFVTLILTYHKRGF